MDQHEHRPGDCCAGPTAAPIGPAPATVRDPVCGMAVDLARTSHRAEHEGTSYGFCCNGCRTKFSADPDRYLGGPRPAVAVPAGTTFTCPMHPEVQQVGSGSCPKCGMALEPMDAAADTGPNHELMDMTRRLRVAAVVTAPVVVLAMSEHLFGFRPLGGAVSNGVQFVLASVVVLWAGLPFFQRGWQSLASRHLNMFTLIAIGTGAAWAYSVVATLAPGLFPAAFREHDGSVAVYFEASAVITVLVLLGQVLELKARASTGAAIRGLLDLAPKTARRIAADGSEHEIAAAAIALGDRFRVRPGERLPVDGVVVEGRGTVDESMVTGESMPVRKEPGAAVIGGTINQTGSLVIAAERIGRDTMLAQIADLVGKAQRSRAPVQRLADTVSGLFVPAVLTIALLAFVAWVTIGPEPRLSHALIAAVSVLIIACPCALGLATPMSMVVGMGRGAQMGILIRDAAILERLEKVDTLVFDKTGTLTEGRPAVTAVDPAAGWSEDDVLRAAASLEALSEHPLAGAVMAAAAARNLKLGAVEEFDAPTGRGVRGWVDGCAVLVGSADFLAEQGVAVEITGAVEAQRRDGATAVFVAIDGLAAGLIGIADPVKPSAQAALDRLRRESIRLVMLTGDHAGTAQAVGQRLGLTEIHADILPDGKAGVIDALKRGGRIVAMAGDGVNDAPALAAADVGIAMGTGTDIAKESAGVTLLTSDLGHILRARHLSRATMANIRQNLGFAFLYNAIGVPVAAGALYPLFGLTLSPMLAAAAMALSSVSVIGNALRLKRTALD